MAGPEMRHGDVRVLISIAVNELTRRPRELALICCARSNASRRRSKQSLNFSYIVF